MTRRKRADDGEAVAGEEVADGAAEAAEAETAVGELEAVENMRPQEFVLRDMNGAELARGTLAQVGEAVQATWPEAGIVGSQWTIHDGGRACGSIRNH